VAPSGWGCVDLVRIFPHSGLCHKRQVGRMKSLWRRAFVSNESCYMLCFATKDQKEGMAAFIEKRSPTFSYE
jgi:hypothetical protein